MSKTKQTKRRRGRPRMYPEGSVKIVFTISKTENDALAALGKPTRRAVPAVIRDIVLDFINR